MSPTARTGSETDNIVADIRTLGMKDGATFETACTRLDEMIERNEYGLGKLFTTYPEYGETEAFPHLVRYTSKEPAECAVKVMEELGEVAECIAKGKSAGQLAMEVCDVKHALALFDGIVPPETMRKAKRLVIAKNYLRGYYGSDADDE